MLILSTDCIMELFDFKIPSPAEKKAGDALFIIRYNIERRQNADAKQKPRKKSRFEKEYFAEPAFCFFNAFSQSVKRRKITVAGKEKH